MLTCRFESIPHAWRFCKLDTRHRYQALPRHNNETSEYGPGCRHSCNKNIHEGESRRRAHMTTRKEAHIPNTGSRSDLALRSSGAVRPGTDATHELKGARGYAETPSSRRPACRPSEGHRRSRERTLSGTVESAGR